MSAVPAPSRRSDSGPFSRSPRRWFRAVAAGVVAAGVVTGTVVAATPASASCAVTNLDCTPIVKPPVQPPATQNSISFTYQLAQLATDSSGAVAAPNMDTTDESSVSPVVLNGCGSRATGSAFPGISSYEWAVGSAAPVYTSTCTWTWQRPVAATASSTSVKLTVIPRVGAPFSLAKPVTYRDVVIASVGDSAASGQGTLHYNISPQCYRSGLAGSAQDALRMQQALGANVSVHFWFLACSGARITSADSSTWAGVPGAGTHPADWGGMLTPYAGAKNPNETAPLTPQVDRLKQLKTESGLPIATLLMTVGANDTGWALVAQDCLIAGAIAAVVPSPEAEAAQSACLFSLQPQIAASMASLPAHFGLLATALPAVVPANRVYLTDYFDPEDSYSAPTLVCPGELMASYSLRTMGISWVQNPMQSDVQAAAAANGWHYLSGNRAAFQGHGVCNADTSAAGRWVNSMTDSKLGQQDFVGTWHPNTYGQKAIAAVEYPILSAAVTQAMTTGN